MKLAIISHTEHYKTKTGQLVGWSPTVNEINHLAPYFDSIVHIAMFHDNEAPLSASPYTSKNIQFVNLPALGGKSLGSKLKVVWNIPKVIRIVRKELKTVDAFQLRTPTGIGVFLIPYVTLFSSKEGWFKYAGNWNQSNPPLGYRLQRWFLKHQSRTVTINGKWNPQPQHCLTFENPCLTVTDIEVGQHITKNKPLPEQINFCYVGRLETPKGVGRIIKAFSNLPPHEKRRVGKVDLVGDGAERKQFEALVVNTGIDFRFHGFLNKKSVFEIYKASHFFLMPTTASEGFPKVIAEASNFGCIPIVSGVSAISQYVIHKENGYIINPITSEGLAEQLKVVFTMTPKDYKSLLDASCKFVTRFTFNHYNKRILNEILN